MGLINWTGLSPLFISLLLLFFITWLIGLFVILRRLRTRISQGLAAIFLILGPILVLLPIEGIGHTGVSKWQVVVLFAYLWFINPTLCLLGIYEAIRHIKDLVFKKSDNPVVPFDPLRREFLKGATISSVGFINLGVFIRPLVMPEDMPQVRHYTIPLSRPIMPLKLAFISDLHAGFFLSQRLTENSQLIISKQKPDYILIGGDIVDHNSTDLWEIGAFIEGLRKVCPVIAVLGNHDILSGAMAVEAFMTQRGVTVLRDSSVPLSENLTLYGLRDEMHERINPTFSVAEDHALIILTHNPRGLYHLDRDQLSKAQFVLAGHTHGGQIRLPWLGALVNPGGSQFKAGINRIGKDIPPVLVTAGIGYTGLPLRINCDPEVAFINLRGGHL